MAQEEDGTIFKLEGRVLISSTVNGVTTTDELDPKIVLQCIMSCLTQGLDNMEKAYESKTDTE